MAFLFAATSLLFGTWVAAIPAMKEKFSLTDGSLGLMLLLSPTGAVTGVFLSPRIFSRIPVGQWMIIGFLALSTMALLLIHAVNLPMLGACLYGYGMISFLNGVSINATASAMEQRYNRYLMSSCHALYSLGGAVSAGLAAFLLSWNVVPGWQMLLMVAIIFMVLWGNRHHLLAQQEIIHSGSGLRLPSASVLGISFICMVLFMAEGCVADWSGIYFKEVLKAPTFITSMGYGLFAVAMTVGRLNGDAVVTQTGNKKAVITGCLLATAGFVLVVLTQQVVIALLGYLVIGLGCSVIVPVLFRTAAAIPGLSKVEGFAMVTTGGLIGFLAGPSVIGMISDYAGLPRALSLVAVLTACAALVAWRNRFFTAQRMPGSDPFHEHLQ